MRVSGMLAREVAGEECTLKMAQSTRASGMVIGEMARD